MAPSDRGTEDTLGAPGIERLLALTDGVVAIALTLLVARITVPTVGATRSSRALGHDAVA